MKSISRKACLLTGSMALAGCAATNQAPSIDSRANTPLASNHADITKEAATPLQSNSETSKPKPVTTTRVNTFEGTIRAIDHKSRRVTFLLADGKRVTVNIAARAGDLSSLQIGDHAAFELAETVEIIQNHFHPETGAIVEEPAVGSAKERESYNPYYSKDTHASSKVHHVSWIEVIDIPALIISVNAETRAITLKTYEGRTFAVRMGPDIKDLGELIPGKAIVARFREIDDITEIAPK